MQGIYRPGKKLIEPAPENCAAFQEFPIGKCVDYPDALSIKLAAELIGCALQTVGDWMRRGAIASVSISIVAK